MPRAFCRASAWPQINAKPSAAAARGMIGGAMACQGQANGLGALSHLESGDSENWAPPMGFTSLGHQNVFLTDGKAVVQRLVRLPLSHSRRRALVTRHSAQRACRGVGTSQGPSACLESRFCTHQYLQDMYGEAIMHRCKPAPAAPHATLCDPSGDASALLAVATDHHMHGLKAHLPGSFHF